MEWKTFGWHGFVMSVPGDWDLAAQEGGDRKGYFRLNDSTMPRLEVKWQRKRRQPGLDAMERAYRLGLKKAKGLESIDLPERAVIRVPAGESRRFRWQGRVLLDDTLVSCADTKRAVSLRIFARSRTQADEFSRGVAGGFRDRSAEATAVWTAYGFACGVPGEYRLERSDLRAGFVLLRFRRRRDQLEFQRLRLGVVPDEARDLDRWSERVLGKEKTEGEAAECEGHPGKRYLLKGLRPGGRLRSPLRKNMREAWLWRCPESESLYLVKQTAGTEKKTWQVWCHGEPDGGGNA
jgi:hypothetical protein